MWPAGQKSVSVDGLANALAIGLASSLASSLANGLASSLAKGLASGLTNGLASSLANGLASLPLCVKKQWCCTLCQLLHLSLATCDI